MSGDREQAGGGVGGATEWWQLQEGARRLEDRKARTVEDEGRTGLLRAEECLQAALVHFECSLASFLSSPLFTYSITPPGCLSHLAHAATCVKLQAPFGASACCRCVLPSETTLCWTLDWQEAAVHSGSSEWNHLFLFRPLPKVRGVFFAFIRRIDGC